MNWTDNAVTRFLGRIADFVVLNILWIVCSIPVVTIGASTTAMYSVMLKIVKNEEGYIVRGFLKAFRENLKKSTVIWLIYIAFGILVYFDMTIAGNMKIRMQTTLQVFFIIMGILLISVGIYAFALQARYENTVKNTLKNALLLTIARLPYTLLLLIVTAGPVLLTLLTVRTLLIGMIVWMFVGVSLIIWINSIILRRVFRIFENE